MLAPGQPEVGLSVHLHFEMHEDMRNVRAHDEESGPGAEGLLPWQWQPT